MGKVLIQRRKDNWQTFRKTAHPQVHQEEQGLHDRMDYKGVGEMRTIPMKRENLEIELERLLHQMDGTNNREMIASLAKRVEEKAREYKIVTGDYYRRQHNSITPPHEVQSANGFVTARQELGGIDY